MRTVHLNVTCLCAAQADCGFFCFHCGFFLFFLEKYFSCEQVCVFWIQFAFLHNCERTLYCTFVNMNLLGFKPILAVLDRAGASGYAIARGPELDQGPTRPVEMVGEMH